jgi:hypothetical protein
MHKVTLPEEGQSFAFIYSVEDPGDVQSGVRGVGAQVMGADDGYVCQFARDTGGFWGARNSLELGACFKPAPGARAGAAPRRIVPQVGRGCWWCGGGGAQIPLLPALAQQPGRPRSPARPSALPRPGPPQPPPRRNPRPTATPHFPVRV